MKKLQNNFTTPEQSKRLLELGVPADSADLMYDISEIERETYDFPTFVYGRFSRYTDGLYVPCWSVGRMIEILTICNHFGTTTIDWVQFCKEQSPLQTIYDELCAGITQALLDFSKLEE